MSVRETVALHFQQVAREQKRKLASLSDSLKLVDSGLDSLSFALIVVRLEEALGSADGFPIFQSMITALSGASAGAAK